jgi:hypothetical protein
MENSFFFLLFDPSEAKNDGTFFFAVLELELRALYLEPFHQPFFVKGFFEIRLMHYLAGLASNCDPPDLCLLSS